MVEASNYRITIQRRETEDGLLFEGTVHELPDVAVYSDSFDEAYEFVLDAIEGLNELATEQGRSFPQPSERETEYSGKFVARMPKSLHRDLAVSAADEGTSLNSYVVSVLSAHKSRGTVVIQHIAVPTVRLLTEDAHLSSGSAAEISGLGKFLPDFGPSGSIDLVSFIEEERSASDWSLISQNRRVSSAT